ncbi:unnamed protein product [Closterium sp. NIES-53]
MSHPCSQRATLAAHLPPTWLTLATLGFAPSTADLSLFLRTDTLLPLFYALVYVDDLVFATADTEALAHVKSELQKRHTCTDLGPSALRLPVLLAIVHSSAYRTSGMGLVLGGRGPVVLTGHANASWVDDLAIQRSSQGYTFSPGSGSVSWRSTRSSSQRGQLHLAYVATRANTADLFTKALQSGGHQRFSIVLGLVSTLPHLLTA